MYGYYIIPQADHPHPCPLGRQVELVRCRKWESVILSGLYIPLCACFKGEQAEKDAVRMILASLAASVGDSS